MPPGRVALPLQGQVQRAVSVVFPLNGVFLVGPTRNHSLHQNQVDLPGLDGFRGGSSLYLHNLHRAGELKKVSPVEPSLENLSILQTFPGPFLRARFHSRAIWVFPSALPWP